jgi:hypothetical protein
MSSARKALLVAVLFLSSGLLHSLAGQTVEIAGNASLGAVISDEGNPSTTGGVGASLGWPVNSKHKLQFDYDFAAVRFPFDSHFLTASYVLQGKPSRVRPFFQIGAGVEIQKFDHPSFLPRGFPFDNTRTNLALVFGGGASIDVGERFFIRPELRSYAVFGPALFVLPMLTVGARF